MASRRDKQDLENLERVNAELNASLSKCRELLADCRSKLVANTNGSKPLMARNERQR
ncbi:hypothetical protein [Sphingomonas sp.]|uniref:hypothetical protein n=1 Tax=Sphingomonas sp. TaxID=28214 RepID=UPI0017D85DDA|nr:hypothetical protein [Sphingomonas sp.]MBA3512283.1 hypothetical protein [Sphingomonas sp.]